MKPLQTLDALDWRATPPDAPGRWIIQDAGGSEPRTALGEVTERGGALWLSTLIQARYEIRLPDDWRPYMRCAPIPASRAEVERETREGVVEECARFLDACAEEAAAQGHQNVGRGLWDAAAAAIRARFAAPRAEAK